MLLKPKLNAPPPFRCLGSTQHLKNLYGAGYTLEVKLKHIEYTTTTTITTAATATAPVTTTATIPAATTNHTSVAIVSGANGGAFADQQPQPTSFDISSEQEERSATLREFVAKLFPDACLEESFADRLVYSVPQNAVSSLAQCFSKLERGKVPIELYLLLSKY